MLLLHIALSKEDAACPKSNGKNHTRFHPGHGRRQAGVCPDFAETLSGSAFRSLLLLHGGDVVDGLEDGITDFRGIKRR